MSEPPSPSDTEPVYRVGRCRPPRHTRFKKGQTGNPRGRKKGRRNLRTVVQSELNQRIRLREGDKVRAATKQEALVMTLFDGALKRDPKATVALLKLLQSVGIMAEAPEPTSSEPVTDRDAEIIADFLRRQGASTEIDSATENDVNNRQSDPSSKEK
jgi:hypothetical protein